MAEAGESRVAGVPEKPDWLLPAAAEEWDRLLPELAERGLVDGLNWGLFAGYCTAYARWVEAEKWMNENGTYAVYRDDKGTVKSAQVVPQVGIAHKALASMRTLGAIFGVKPTSRRVKLRGVAGESAGGAGELGADDGGGAGDRRGGDAVERGD